MPKKPKWNYFIKQSCQIKYGNKLSKWQAPAMTSHKATCKSTGNFWHLQDKTPLSETEMCLILRVTSKSTGNLSSSSRHNFS